MENVELYLKKQFNKKLEELYRGVINSAKLMHMQDIQNLNVVIASMHPTQEKEKQWIYTLKTIRAIQQYVHSIKHNMPIEHRLEFMVMIINSNKTNLYSNFSEWRNKHKG